MFDGHAALCPYALLTAENASTGRDKALFDRLGLRGEA